MSEFKAEFYENGDEIPVKEFLDSLDDKMRAKFSMEIKLLEEKGNQTLWLLYDGISEDRQNYRFWLVRCEGPDWKHSDGQIWSEGEYTVAIREKA